MAVCFVADMSTRPSGFVRHVRHPFSLLFFFLFFFTGLHLSHSGLLQGFVRYESPLDGPMDRRERGGVSVLSLGGQEGDGSACLASTPTREAHRHGRVPVVPTWKRGSTHGMQSPKTTGVDAIGRGRHGGIEKPNPIRGERGRVGKGWKTPCIHGSTETPRTKEPTTHPWVRSDRPPKKTRKLHHETKVEICVNQCPPFFLQDVRNRPRSIQKGGHTIVGFRDTSAHPSGHGANVPSIFPKPTYRTPIVGVLHG